MLHCPLKASTWLQLTLQANAGFLLYCTSAIGNSVNYFLACMSLVCVCVLQQIAISTFFLGSISLTAKILLLFFWHLSAKTTSHLKEDVLFFLSLYTTLPSTHQTDKLLHAHTSRVASLKHCTVHKAPLMQQQSLHEGLGISREASEVTLAIQTSTRKI